MSQNTFTLAVIGCGRWGMNHVRTAHRLFGADLRAVFDADASCAARIRDVDPSIRFVSDVREILDDEAITAVVVATPAETHYEITRSCLEAGKDVLVEKPITLHSNEARELERLANERGRILMVGHLLLYHPAILKIKELIDDGTLGRLQYIYSNRLNLGTVRKEENILWSFAPHDISVLQLFIGKTPLRVESIGGTFLQPRIHDTTMTTLEYPGNVHAHIYVSWLHPFKEHRLVVIGDRTMVTFDDTRKTDKLVLYPKGIDWINGEPIKRDDDFQVVDFGEAMPLDAELEHFAECVRTRTRPRSDARNGIEVLEILEVAQQRLENTAAPAAEPVQEPRAYYVHETAMVDEGCRIGAGTKIWHFSHVQTGARIGSKCSLGQNVNVGNNVTIGDNVKIQNNVSVYEGVTLEDYVFCGPSMVFTNVINPRCEFPQRGSEHYARTIVRYGASIGANATIVCGHNVGRFAFVGAGSVVTRDVPDYALVVGNPARIVGWMCRCGTKLEFVGSEATCPKCDREYARIAEHEIAAVEAEPSAAVEPAPTP